MSNTDNACCWEGKLFCTKRSTRVMSYFIFKFDVWIIERSDTPFVKRKMEGLNNRISTVTLKYTL